MSDGILFSFFLAGLAYLLTHEKSWKTLLVCGAILGIGVLFRLQGLAFIPFIPILFMNEFSLKRYCSAVGYLIIPSVIGLLSMTVFVYYYTHSEPASLSCSTDVENLFFYWPAIKKLLSSVSLNFFTYLLNNLMLFRGLLISFILLVFLILGVGYHFFIKSYSQKYNTIITPFLIFGVFLILFPAILYSTDRWPFMDPRYSIYGLSLISLVTCGMIFEVSENIFQNVKRANALKVTLAVFLFVVSFMIIVTASQGRFRSNPLTTIQKGFQQVLSFSDYRIFFKRTLHAYRPYELSETPIKENFRSDSVVLTTSKFIQNYFPSIKMVQIYVNAPFIEEPSFMEFYSGKNNEMLDGLVLDFRLADSNIFFHDQKFVD